MSGEQNLYTEARERMVQEQLAARDIRDSAVLAAFRETPRELFVLPQDRSGAYEDMPLPIGQGQTISQPYIVAYMAEALRLKPSDRVLEIGTGSGYAAAILSHCAAKVYSVEIIRELYERASALLKRLHYKNVVCYLRDGHGGIPEEAPFDKIMLSAAPRTVPQELLQQLAVGGLLIAPIGPVKLFQRLSLIEKLGRDSYKESELLGVSFVEMTRDASL